MNMVTSGVLGSVRPTLADMVEDFHRRILNEAPKEKGLLSKEEFDFRWRAYIEELHELSIAHDSKDFIGCIDAVIDLMYFATGALVWMGLSSNEIDRCIAAVHCANMQKKLGVVERRGDGTVPDAIKPEGWVSPEEMIAEIIGGSR